jgi:hypothetical protein
MLALLGFATIALLGFPVSPLTPATFLIAGLAGVERGYPQTSSAISTIRDSLAHC